MNPDVQAAVAVRLRIGDEVANTLGDRWESIVYQSENIVAGEGVVGFQYHREVHVVLGIERVQGALHEVVVAPQTLGTHAYLGGKALVGKQLRQSGFNMGHLLGVAHVLNDMKDLFALPGVEKGESEVIEFTLYGVEVQSGGDGGVDLDGFLGYPLAFGLGQKMKCSQVVETVGQFDDKHAEPSARADEYLAVGEILKDGAVEMVAGELRATVHELGNHRAELVLDVFE